MKYCFIFIAVLLTACLTPEKHRNKADSAAKNILHEKKALLNIGNRNFSIEKPSETLRERLLIDQKLQVTGDLSYGSEYLKKPIKWPEENYPETKKIPSEKSDGIITPIVLSVEQALEAGAANSPEYQDYKEKIFKAALNLDLEKSYLKKSVEGSVSNQVYKEKDSDRTTSGNITTGIINFKKKFGEGLDFTTDLTIDLVKLLIQDKNLYSGINLDSSISIPLLRGFGKHIQMAALTQAEKNVVYRIYDFKRFQKIFAVDIIKNYLYILEQHERKKNFLNNYNSLVIAAEKSEKLKNAGRITQIDLDRAIQDRLEAEQNWLSSVKDVKNSMDRFKILLGIPSDAIIELNKDRLNKITESYLRKLREGSGPVFSDIPDDESELIKTALEQRLDIKTAVSEVEDAQRNIIVLADALKTKITLSGLAGLTRDSESADSEENKIKLFSTLLTIDLPLNKEDRNAYRNAYIDLEKSVRKVQKLEDSIKFSVREKFRDLKESEGRLKIQYKALKLAQKRIKSASLFFEAGQADLKDILDAEKSLLSAGNSLTNAVINLVSAKFELLRDTGNIDPDKTGNQYIWTD